MTRKICCLGDSITWTATSRSIHPYPHYLEQLLGPGYIVGNQAVSGYTISQIQSLWTDYVAGEDYDDVILLGGINDLRVGTAYATVFATWKAVVDAILAEGKRLVGMNTLQMRNYASAWTPAREENRRAFNELVAGYLTGRTNCTFIDASLEFERDIDPRQLKAIWNIGDDLHPNQAGTYRLAELARDALLGTAQTLPTFLPYFADGISVGNFSPYTAPWDEISGICRPAKAVNSTYLWAITDAGYSPVIMRAYRFADAADGGVWTLTGAVGVDIEDITSATVDGQPYIYIGDTGDNAAARTTFNIFRIKEPAITGGSGTLAAGTDWEQIVCNYPGTPTGEGGTARRDAEAMFADPDTGDLYVLTKRTTQVQVFRLAHAASYTGTQTLTYLGDMFQLPNTENPGSVGNGGRTVAADISPDGKEIVVKNYATVYHFPRDKTTQTIYQALQNASPAVIGGYVGGTRPASHPNNEPQGEAICFGYNGQNLYTASEYNTTLDSGRTDYPLFRYQRLGAAITSVSFQDGVAAYTGTRDTYLWDLAGSNTQIRGAEATFVVDWELATTSNRVGLLKFDLSSIPAGARIVGVDLQLYINTEGSIAQVHRMLEAWDENTTYTTLGHIPARNDVQASSAVEAYFGDYTGFVTGAGGIGMMTLKMPINTVQMWLDGTLTNNGWMFYQPTTTDGNGFQFRSREAVTAADRPKLTVRYVGP